MSRRAIIKRAKIVRAWWQDELAGSRAAIIVSDGSQRKTDKKAQAVCAAYRSRKK